MNGPQQFARRQTRAVKVGNLTIGGGAPISVQSMTNTVTADVPATLAQIRALAAAGADIVRLATPTAADTAALKDILPASPVPIVADVHFHFERALEAIAAGVHKIRLNPGNISDRGKVRAVIDAAKAAGIPIRIGVNEGSVRPRTGPRSGSADKRPLPQLMVDAIRGYLEIFAQASFDDLVLSAKSHDAANCIAAYRELSRQFDYPLHLGLTHAGTVATGTIRSVAAMGTLLAEGVGDTLRISLAGEPTAEVAAAVELLCALGLRERRSVEVIACPTCGRTTADVAELAEQIRRGLSDVKRHISVAVMGCVVNGPGEAQMADLAVCCGVGKAAIYRQGKLLGTVPDDQIVQSLLAEARKLLNE
jgi:(E)-4-hydroxy-3-methylbut-2-enyl-diphosphate synthase